MNKMIEKLYLTMCAGALVHTLVVMKTLSDLIAAL